MRQRPLAMAKKNEHDNPLGQKKKTGNGNQKPTWGGRLEKGKRGDFIIPGEESFPNDLKNLKTFQ